MKYILTKGGLKSFKLRQLYLIAYLAIEVNILPMGFEPIDGRYNHSNWLYELTDEEFALADPIISRYFFLIEKGKGTEMSFESNISNTVDLIYSIDRVINDIKRDREWYRSING